MTTMTTANSIARVEKMLSAARSAEDLDDQNKRRLRNLLTAAIYSSTATNLRRTSKISPAIFSKIYNWAQGHGYLCVERRRERDLLGPPLQTARPVLSERGKKFLIEQPFEKEFEFATEAVHCKIKIKLKKNTLPDMLDEIKNTSEYFNETILGVLRGFVILTKRSRLSELEWYRLSNTLKDIFKKKMITDEDVKQIEQLAKKPGRIPSLGAS